MVGADRGGHSVLHDVTTIVDLDILESNDVACYVTERGRQQCAVIANEDRSGETGHRLVLQIARTEAHARGRRQVPRRLPRNQAARRIRAACSDRLTRADAVW